eukprot:gnl/TRDRNA2_/TRDRNA2_159266_c1_seq1.p1 gnl/TRDRNA2_/TRDRNA2_159266_c1~~gnl/TRDRNA2_/TRDRNA2_159266_c1_seq1.p1  ORF type:complete len:327 (-),score=47.65 gnl/TRDRNA2_/TRDRNA2_159266_c1_seq1:44-1024(-)
MADGTQKQLQHVLAGEQVASWDEISQNVVASTVRAVPTYTSSYHKLMEVSLPSSVLHVTEDHPFWSRSRNALVSSNPNVTMQEYQLEAHLMSSGDELENEKQESVKISSMQRLGMPSHAWAPRGFDGQSASLIEAQTFTEEWPEVEVMTLCLDPHHWYYVHNVRVHNKGCFVKNTEILLADGAVRQLQHIVPGDQVASWDETAQRVVTSTVMATPTFLRNYDELVDVTLPSAVVRVTKDHPFWSRNRRGLVSSHPEQTAEEYELETSLMKVGDELENAKQENVTISSVQQLKVPPHLRALRREDWQNGSEDLCNREVLQVPRGCVT